VQLTEATTVSKLLWVTPGLFLGKLSAFSRDGDGAAHDRIFSVSVRLVIGGNTTGGLRVLRSQQALPPLATGKPKDAEPVVDDVPRLSEATAAVAGTVGIPNSEPCLNATSARPLPNMSGAAPAETHDRHRKRR
jgi:hypothetical protein